MTTYPTPLKPGIFTDVTAYAARQNYIAGNRVRFREKYPETTGGCLRYESAITFDGVPRAQREWAKLDGTTLLAVGGHKKVELVAASAKYDITPYAYIVTGTLVANPFTTTATSTTVSVAHVAHGRAIGDIVEYANGPTLDGIDFGKYAFPVLGITSADIYTITVYTVATGSTGGGGGAGITYGYNSKIVANNPIATTLGLSTVVMTDAAHGLSTGATITTVGATAINGVTANGTFGPITKIDANSYSFDSGTTASGTSSGGGAVVRVFRCVDVGLPSGLTMRLPSIWNWGEDLLFTLGANSRVYLWDATLGYTTRARAIPRAPSCDFIMVSPDDQSLVCFGTDGDNMNIDWSDELDYTIFLAAASNTAGDKRLLNGSKLVAAIPVMGGSLVFTDTAAHLMTFTGGDFVYSILMVGRVTIAGQNAVAEKDGTAYGMGKNQFFMYDGRFRTIDCTVMKWVYGDDNDDEKPGINTTEIQGVCAGINARFGEAWFFYPDEASTYNSRYAAVQFEDNELPWSLGLWQRLTWTDADIINMPLACDASGLMYQHEYGRTDNGVSLGSTLATGDLQIDAMGEQFMFGKRVVLDHIMTGNFYFTVRARNTQQGTYRYSGPSLILEGDEEAWQRFRGRRIGYMWETPSIFLDELATESLDIIITEDGQAILCDGVPSSSTPILETSWRLGTQMPDVRPDGTRGGS